MKKNKMMRIASVLLVAVLLSTCAISGTFAKYTSTATATATATVAKWDIKLDSNAFADATFSLAETWTDTRTPSTSDINVGDKLLAPGTEGSFDFVITNDSEVVVSYDITLSEALAPVPAGYTEDAFPVKYSVNGGATWDTDISALSISGTLGIGEAVTAKVMWCWDYNGNDTVDTAFGATHPDVTITASIEVTQVD